MIEDRSEQVMVPHRISLVGVLGVITTALACSIGGSSTHSSDAERALPVEHATDPLTAHRPAVSRTNGLVPAGHPLTSMAGMQVLMLGGTVAQPSFELPWVQIPAGTFHRGCVPADNECLGDERPRHAVKLSRPFELMATEVTVAHYLRFARVTQRSFPRQPDFKQTGVHPMVYLDWDDATAFCEWSGGRLPTEAEWEYAARAGHADRIYGWGDELSSDRANFGTNVCCDGVVDGSDQWLKTAPVGSFPPNDFGIYDMIGNVWEWVADWHAPYGVGPVVDPDGPEMGFGRVARGGSWLNAPSVLRLSVRLTFDPNGQTSNIGTRCARDVPTMLAYNSTAEDIPSRFIDGALTGS